jgi:hypothetical protein
MQKISFGAFDTETREGKAFLYTWANDKGSGSIDIKNAKDLEFVFSEMIKHKILFAYNLDYDCLALLKWILNDQRLTEMYYKNEFTWKKFKFKILPKKMMKISDNRNSVECYDLLQFFDRSLDSAGESFLGEKKVQIGEENRKNYYEYFQKNKKIATDYAIKDAELTYRLGIMFIDWLEKAGVQVDKYYSSGYLAFKHLQDKYSIKLPLISEKVVQDFVKRAFFGGRIEFTKRGYLKNINIYDINSAYPSVIKELKKIMFYRWGEKIHVKADYYFVECSFILDDIEISPLAYRTNTGMVIYPTGEVNKVVLDNYTFNNVLKHCTNMKVHKVLNVFCSEEKLYSHAVEDLFKQRKVSEGNNYVFKKILNSLYGKMVASKKQFVEIPEPQTTLAGLHDKFLKEVAPYCPTCEKLGFVSEKCRKQNCKKYRKDIKEVTGEGCFFWKGRFYKHVKTLDKKTNIIYGALITAKIRNLMFEVAEEVGFKNVAGFMTDAIFCNKKIPKKYISKNLGDFSLKTENSFLYVIGSGIYQTEDDSKTRGFRIKANLMEEANKNKNKDFMRIDTTTKTGVGTVLQRNLITDELNIITDINKDINLNFDKKRNWKKNFINFEESLKTNINSKTIKL